MKKVKDNTLGFGLSCSRDIFRSLGGDILLKHSQEKFTVFSITIPIEVFEKVEGSDYLDFYLQDKHWIPNEVAKFALPGPVERYLHYHSVRKISKVVFSRDQRSNSSNDIDLVANRISVSH